MPRYEALAMKKIFLMLALIFTAGCMQAKDFNYGIKQLDSVNSKYKVTMESYPGNIKDTDSMLNDLEGLKKLQLRSGQESFNYAVNYRILNLEAERLYIESQKYGNSGTTNYGFGCKIRPLIIESASLRNRSALKGFEAVNLLAEFVDKHPKDANSIGLSFKNTLFLNATFYQLSMGAGKDSGIINYFCPENVTLELYQQQFVRETNFSKDYIKSLRYSDAVKLWKISRGID